MSDFIHDSGDRAGQVVLGLGCGCLALVLLVGGLGVAVIARGGMACQEGALSNMRAHIGPVQAMLDKVAAGEIAAAYAGLGERYRAEHALGDFQDLVTGHGGLFAGGVARFSGTRRRTQRRTQRRQKGYYLVVQILDEGGTEKGLATFYMTPGEGSTQIINDIMAGVPEARMAEDGARETVKKHVARLSRGDLDGAFTDLEAGGMDRQTFGVFVESQGGLFDDSQARILSFESGGRRGEVLVEIVGEDGAPKGRVVYRLMLGSERAWKIVAIETVREGSQ